MLLLVKSVSPPNYSGKRRRREGRPNNKLKRPRNCPTGTRCYICNQENYWASECSINKLSSKSYKRKTYQSDGSINLAINCLQSLGECKVDKMLMVTYNSFPTTGILLNYGTIAYMFTNKQHFSTYVKMSL